MDTIIKLAIIAGIAGFFSALMLLHQWDQRRRGKKLPPGR